MRVARYLGEGKIGIVEEPKPECPTGGLLVRTEACGLCSGELMSWYMDRKVPHVLGHEVAGIVVESDSSEFPLGARVFPHHHAPCLKCDFCQTGRYVHCAQWKRSKLVPGGMAEFFAVGVENLHDTLKVDDLRPVDAALIEPLACVMKALETAGDLRGRRVGVIGLGTMGLMHALSLGPDALAYDLNPQRIQWARTQGICAGLPEEFEPADVVFVCPGSQAAFEFGLKLLSPGGTLVMFAPLGPGEELRVPQSAYFSDIAVKQSYSCGPTHTQAAAKLIRDGRIRAEQVCSHFIALEELPVKYLEMKAGAILKPMVVWP